MPAREQQVCTKQRHKDCLRQQCKLQGKSPHLSIDHISQQCHFDRESRIITA